MSAPLCSQFFQSALMFSGENIARNYLEKDSHFDSDYHPKPINVILSGAFGGKFVLCYCYYHIVIIVIILTSTLLPSLLLLSSLLLSSLLHLCFCCHDYICYCSHQHYSVIDIITLFIIISTTISIINFTIFLTHTQIGLTKCLVLVPSDLIKCKMQVDRCKNGKKGVYTGSFDCFMKVQQKEGIIGLFRGFTVTSCREVPSFAIYFFVYRYSSNILNNLFIGTKNNDNKSLTSPVLPPQKPGFTTLLAGGLAGI